ncbi:hypothetical protein AIOL_000122 [Candidatus Rhodobacter oscarellae]|uniref:Glycosyltransferase n=1 Tax=Candidatus Rhodobacter oscarellae TaxID=1675527 RepID=A0A0J9H2R9_9RHOB|nr:glycosyltransferase family A protein [Candidatus Rhodobacter lobularis]KMW59973.1 hypothetical protein AIOL_000122 [Candidatus Rhodobacter lobularis]
MLIISLSSIPPRFPYIKPTLDSLLAQDVTADRILLHIPRAYRRFPEWDGTLPDVPAGVEILRCEEDLGPATKVLPAARAFRGEDVDLLFCDDDRIYPSDWGRRLCEARSSQPEAALCLRGMMVAWKTGQGVARVLRPQAKPSQDWQKWLDKRAHPGAEAMLFRASGHVDMFEGCGGVLVRPEMFDDAASDIPDVAWPVDDVWLSGMLAAKGVPIWLEAGARSAAHAAAPLDDAARHDQNIAAIRHLQAHHGVWLP